MASTTVTPDGVASSQHGASFPCPRCDSINTKFCYYNNYNVSQPRHYCKTCQRYWTHGGRIHDCVSASCRPKKAKNNKTRASRRATAFMGVMAVSRSESNLPSHNAAQEKETYNNHGSSCKGIPGFVHPMSMYGPFTGPTGDATINMGVSLTSSKFIQPPPSFLELGGFGLGLGMALRIIGLPVNGCMLNNFVQCTAVSDHGKGSFNIH